MESGDCILFELDFGEHIPFDEITSFPIRNAADILACAEKAERFWTYKKQGFRNKCMSYIFDILSNVNRDGGYVSSSKYEIIKPSIKYLEEHLDDPDIDTEYLARISGISIPYFRKLFCEIYKMPVAKYIESVRIGKARELLKNDYGSVGEVAECVGYRNIYHFSKAFKKVTGVSPTEFSRG
ncbi:MAG: helix-turn-helix transcriptional regulator [Clostridia bacterium]|nr:helix-turn-helix transcriptional regulator [Clostridia bacterium]